MNYVFSAETFISSCFLDDHSSHILHFIHFLKYFVRILLFCILLRSCLNLANFLSNWVPLCSESGLGFAHKPIHFYSFSLDHSDCLRILSFFSSPLNLFVCAVHLSLCLSVCPPVFIHVPLSFFCLSVPRSVPLFFVYLSICSAVIFLSPSFF